MIQQIISGIANSRHYEFGKLDSYKRDMRFSRRRYSYILHFDQFGKAKSVTSNYMKRMYESIAGHS